MKDTLYSHLLRDILQQMKPGAFPHADIPAYFEYLQNVRGYQSRRAFIETVCTYMQARSLPNPDPGKSDDSNPRPTAADTSTIRKSEAAPQSDSAVTDGGYSISRLRKGHSTFLDVQAESLGELGARELAHMLTSLLQFHKQEESSSQ